MTGGQIRGVSKRLVVVKTGETLLILEFCFSCLGKTPFTNKRKHLDINDYCLDVGPTQRYLVPRPKEGLRRAGKTRTP